MIQLRHQQTYPLVVETLRLKPVLLFTANEGEAVANMLVLANAEGARSADDEAPHELDQIEPRWIALVRLVLESVVDLFLHDLFPEQTRHNRTHARRSKVEAGSGLEEDMRSGGASGEVGDGTKPFW